MCQERLSGIPLIVYVNMHVHARSIWNKAEFMHNLIHATHYMLIHVHDGKSYNISCLPIQLQGAENCTA